MAFCSFDKEAVKNLSTSVDNYYITEFMPEASGDAVKVYLYGLYLCKDAESSFSVSDFAKSLYMDEQLVKDYFRYWEDYDAVTIISEEPFTVRYMQLTVLGKPKKFKSGKYDDFNKSVQSLITERMISTNEFVDYFTVMEEHGISQEAMLMIVRYCVDLKGANIGGKYIVAVAKSFAERGITTVSMLEAELNDYNNFVGDLNKVLSAMNIKKKADIDDYNLYDKWIKELNFTAESIVFVAKKQKIKTFALLDKVMTELYQAKKFTAKEIENYFLEKEKITELSKTLLRELSVYVEVVTPVIENYVNPWLSLGFLPDTLVFIANYCFKRRRRSLEAMDDTVKSLYQKGLVTLSAIGDYIKNRAKEDEFIKELLHLTATDRLPNDWDRKSVLAWREWGFDDEMIKRAAALAGGKTNPLVYMNTILSNWKTEGILTPDKIPSAPSDSSAKAARGSQHTANERTYTKEELDKLIDDIDDINF